MRKLFFISVFCIVANLVALGQSTSGPALSDTTDLANMTIEQLSRLQSTYKATPLEKTIAEAIETASRKPLSMRNSPSIVTVITKDEIERSGARDMMDVFRLIPSVEFNVDVQGVVSLSIRGMWSNEGNVLLQIDGKEMNENAYSGLAFGNHYPITNIKRIEVIRGPGSAIYGGYAEYAVINIITNKGDDIKGVTASAIVGQTATVSARQDVGLTVGNKINDLTYSADILMGRGQRSDGTYTDVYGTSYKMAGNSDLNPHYINLNLAYKDLSVSFLYDNYIVATQDGYQPALSKPYPCDFLTYIAEVKYHKKLSKKVNFLSSFNYKHCQPWTYDGTPLIQDSSYNTYKIETQRSKLNLSLLIDPTYWLNVNAGFEGYIDYGYKTIGDLFVIRPGDTSQSITYYNYAPYIQMLFKTAFANITVGARYDINAAYGSAFNPRLGINKRVGIMNFKLLYASSFRAPSIEDIQYAIGGVKIKPEQSNTLEFETSVKFSKNSYLSVNLFDITTKNAIRYFVQPANNPNGDPDGYRNTHGITGSTGLELEYRYKTSFGSLNFIYSYYTIGGKGVDSANLVSINRNATLGTAQNKFTLMASFNLGKHCYITPSVYFLGIRYGYTSVDTNGTGMLSTFGPQAQINLYFGTHDLIRNTTLGVGISNITNQSIEYIQAYNSLHAPLPGLGREFYLKAAYHFDHRNKKAK